MSCSLKTMDAKACFMIPSIHIKKEKISDDEPEIFDPGQLLHFFNKGDDQLLESTAPILLNETKMTVLENGDHANPINSKQPQANQGTCSTPRDENQNFTPKSRNGIQFGDALAESTDNVARGSFENREGKEFRDILTESIDCVARGMFTCADEIERIPAIKPKKLKGQHQFHKRLQQHRISHKGLANSEELSLQLSKPFELNWRREIVHRSSCTETKHCADAYYFSPTGKKFRSLPQVAQYLEDTNDMTLSISSFTFHKSRVTNHPNETERDAKRKGQEAPQYEKKVNNVTKLKVKDIPLDCSNKSNKRQTSEASGEWEAPRYAKKVMRETKLKIKDALPDDSKSSTVQQKMDAVDMDESQKCVSIRSLVFDSNEDSRDAVIENYTAREGISADIKEVCGVKTAGENNRENDRISKEIKEVGNVENCSENNGEDHEIPKCSNNCPGQAGIIPSLHCSVCLCLFHPQCVGLGKANCEIMQFTCKDCRLQPKPSELHPKHTGSYSSAAPLGSISTGVLSSWKISNLQLNCDSPKIYLVKTSKPNTKSPLVTNQFRAPSSQIINSGNAKNFPGGLTIEKVANVTLRLGPTEPDAASISLIRVTHPGSTSGTETITSTTPKSVVSPISQFVSPTLIRQGLYMPYNLIHLNKPSVHGTPQQKPSMQRVNKELNSSSNVNGSHLSSNVNGLHSSPSETKPSIPLSLSPVVHNCSIAPRNSTIPLMTTSPKAPVNSQSLDHSYIKRSLAPILAAASLTSSSNLSSTATSPISLLHGRPEDLHPIFDYLSLSDLMRASLVCQAWRNAIKHPTMWVHVVLRNMKITCWESFAQVICEKGTKHLDMRGMCLYNDRNRTWHEFASVLSQLKGLSKLDIGEVPAAIVHTVANMLPQLECLSAEWIVDSTKDAHNATGNCRLFIQKLCQLPQLRVLRIRGIYGLHLPSPTFDLDCLSSLTHIKHLSLTSFKYQKAPDLNFLKSFLCLSILELGDCRVWNFECFESIGHLKQLKRLRLEFEERSCPKGLMAALQGLINLTHLDLIAFQIPPNLGEILARLTKLSMLCIWPDIGSQAAENNFNTLAALKNTPSVRNFTWGLVTSQLDRRPGDKFDHQVNNVPFLTSVGNNELIEVKINASLLMSKLRAALPSAKVQVMMVPNVSYSTIACLPR